MKTEVAIVGGGPAGAAAALFLAREGIDAVVVEKSSFPRFHIGESFTGSVGKLLRSAGLGDEMIRRQYPVKHGVNVWGPGGKNEFYVPVVDQLPHGERRKATTWQVRRSDFDAMLLEQALDSGAVLVDGVATTPVVDDDGWARGTHIQTSAGEETIEADVLVDASGQQCFLARAGLTSPKLRGDYDAQIAIFTHVQGADRGTSDEPDNTVIVYKEPNHWSWFIPIDSDIVSVGVVVPAAYFRAQNESLDDFMAREFRELNPELTWRVDSAEMVIEPKVISNYSYHVERYVGPGWLCVGDSHQFVDPVFSFGVHFAMHEGWKAAKEIKAFFAADERREDAFDHYEDWTSDGQQIIRDLVDTFWGEPLAFGYFAHRKYPDDLVDLFAGRVYDITEPSPGLQALRKVSAKVRARTAAAATP